MPGVMVRLRRDGRGKLDRPPIRDCGGSMQPTTRSVAKMAQADNRQMMLICYDPLTILLIDRAHVPPPQLFYRVRCDGTGAG
jgi:hypothetical protein